MKNTKGFTLIELVVVIVVLGILAITALPKFIDISTDAEIAAVKGVAGAATSASIINYSSRKVNATYGIAVSNCSDVTNLLQGGLPASYTITATAIGADATINCIVNGPKQSTTAAVTGTL